MLNQNNIKMIESKNKIAPGIYLVSTPLGNRYDITLRAIYIFIKAELMLCEDTRVTKNLFKLLNIEIKNKMWIAYNDHKSKKNFPLIYKKFSEGKIICLVSDAGTPLISDPGYRLIQFAKRKDIKLYTIPGPCSVISALSISGLKSDQFLFIGFLPKKKGEYIDKLKYYHNTSYTLIIFERANRLNYFLSTFLKEFNNYNIVLAKELTKINEEIINITPENIEDYIEKTETFKGEYTVIVEFNEPLKKKKFSDKVLIEELKKLKPSQVATMLSKSSYESRDVIYKRCIKLKKEYDNN